MKIAICDDMQEVCAELENFILDYKNMNNVQLEIDTFNIGEELIKVLKDGVTYDLIFLDIELNSTNGIEIGSVIRNDLENYITKIVYMSSKNNYDRQLFDFQPLHFLEKPLKKEKVLKDLELAIKLVGKNNDLFDLKKGKEIIRIPIKEILYFESLNKQVKVVCSNETIIFYEKLKVIESKLRNVRFLQPHRSYLVNYDFIIKIKTSEVIMSNGAVIPISRNKYKEINDAHIKYMKETFI